VVQESDHLGMLAKVQFAAGTNRQTTDDRGYLGYDRDTLLRQQRIHSSDDFLDVTLLRDFVGNIAERKEPEDGSGYSAIYDYDGMGRLATGDGGSYACDELSNLLKRQASGEDPRTYTYQESGAGGNRMRLSVYVDENGDRHEYSYDANGSLTQRKTNYVVNLTLSYDNLGRLRKVLHWGTQEDLYWYDRNGLRCKKVEHNENAAIREIGYYLYVGQNPILVDRWVGSGPSKAETRLAIVGGEDGSMVLAHYRKVYGGSEALEFFYPDHLGSRRVVASSAGALLDEFSYGVWGEVEHPTGSNAYLASYTGKSYDATGLLYFNARYYDPVIGRFITEDPSRKGTGWYTYCSNNPINRMDPTGRQSTGIEELRRAEERPVGFSDLRMIEKQQTGPKPDESWGYGPEGELLTVRYTTQDVTAEVALRILAEAQDYIRTQYLLGGGDKSGIDCSGLVTASISDAGVPYVHTGTAGMPSSPFLREISKAEARAGDVFLFPEHTGFFNPHSPKEGYPYLSAMSPDTQTPPRWESGVGYAQLKTLEGEPRFFRVRTQVPNW
jgi:RHS repeat-associated protein